MAYAWLCLSTVLTAVYAAGVGAYGVMYWNALWFFWPLGVAWLCTGVGLATLLTVCCLLAWRWLRGGRAMLASATTAAPMALGALVLLRM